MAAKVDNPYCIHFKGLPDGTHWFQHHVDNVFYQEFKQLESPEGNLDVVIRLDKEAGLLNLVVSIDGDIKVRCDRCLDFLSVPIHFKGNLTATSSSTTQDETDDTIYLSQDDYQIDLKHYIFESISLSIPYRNVHPDQTNGRSGCDKEMLDKLDQLLIQNDD